ncbi:MAG: hypothetical protein ACOVP7_01965 [Lacibacter sp.]
MKNNLIILFAAFCFGFALTGAAQQKTKPLGFDLAAGVQTYYAPFLKADVVGLQLVVVASAHQPLNIKNTVGLSLRLGYNKHPKQGDALFTQLLFQYNPVIAKRVELGIGTGVGYQFSFYPSAPLKWNGTEWTEGKAVKGVLQLPVLASAGYRAIHTKAGNFTPYMAYQLNVLLGYTPDLSPLPSSYFLVGVKYSSKK